MDFPPPTAKQARIVWFSLTGLAIGVTVGLLGLLIWGLGFVLKVLSPVLWPLAIAGIFSYLLDPVVDFFERRKVSRQKAIILVFAICVLALGGLFASIAPRVVHESPKLIADLPTYSKNLKEDLDEWMRGKPWFQEWRGRLWPRRAGEVIQAPVTNTPVVS